MDTMKMKELCELFDNLKEDYYELEEDMDSKEEIQLISRFGHQGKKMNKQFPRSAIQRKIPRSKSYFRRNTNY